jgi:hypothetical protein
MNSHGSLAKALGSGARPNALTLPDRNAPSNKIKLTQEQIEQLVHQHPKYVAATATINTALAGLFTLRTQPKKCPSVLTANALKSYMQKTEALEEENEELCQEVCYAMHCHQNLLPNLSSRNIRR